MKRLKVLGLSALMLMSSLYGCSTKVENKPDPTDRTYPQAYNFKIVTIKQLKANVTTPDSVNVKAYVVERIYCPPDVECAAIVGNHIKIAEALHNDENALHLSVTNPLQFKEKHLYTFSLEIKKVNDEEKYFSLLGYSE